MPRPSRIPPEWEVLWRLGGVILHAVELAEVELDQALGELASFVRRFGHLKKLGGVLKAARTTLKKHKRTL